MLVYSSGHSEPRSSEIAISQPCSNDARSEARYELMSCILAREACVALWLALMVNNATSATYNSRPVFTRGIRS